MKIIVAGSRIITSYSTVEAILDPFKEKFSELVSGGARGIDRLAETWGVKNAVPIKQFLPDYDRFGISAPHKRNEMMAKYGEMLVAIYPKGNLTAGTRSMIKYATAEGIEVRQFEV